MSHMITAECVNCSACERECPVQAIRAEADQYVIDPDICVDCEGYFNIARCKWACPVNACVPEREDYQYRATSIAHRGARPVIYKNTDGAFGHMLPEHNKNN